jgi:hypothetical protein
MVDEVVAADAATKEGKQMSVEATDNGDEVAGVLDGVGGFSGFFWTGFRPSAIAVWLGIVWLLDAQGAGVGPARASVFAGTILFLKLAHCRV